VPEDQEHGNSDPLVRFCRDSLSTNLGNWPLNEDALARAFISRFPVSSFLMKDDLQALGAKLGVDVFFRQLPADISGFNGAYEGEREIILSETENPLGISTHTFFHEIRELIEHIFISLGHPTFPPDGAEKRAEEFAMAVRSNSALKESEYLIENALNASSNWLRWISVAAVTVLMASQAVACYMLITCSNACSTLCRVFPFPSSKYPAAARRSLTGTSYTRASFLRMSG